MVFTTDGLVIRETSVGEHDKILTLLTPQHGQLSVSAKGAKSIKSKFLSTAKLFTYGNFEIYKKGDYHYLRDASLIEPFFRLSDDILKMSLASYLCELAKDITAEDVSSVDILRMTLNSFYAISRDLAPLPIIKGVYEIRAAAHSGFMPDLHFCAVCGADKQEYPYLDITNGRLLCKKCRDRIENERMMRKKGEFDDLDYENYKVIRITGSVLAALRYAISAPPERMFSFELSDKHEVSIFSNVTEQYVLYHLERGFYTLDFYKSLQ